MSVLWRRTAKFQLIQAGILIAIISYLVLYTILSNKKAVELSMYSLSQSENDSDLWVIERNGFRIQIAEGSDFTKAAIITINGVEYPFSFEGWNPVAEEPQIGFYDINRDGIMDLFLWGEGYRTDLRQDVYISNSEGRYKELGDITFDNPNNPGVNMQFTGNYIDNYRVHIDCDELGITGEYDIKSEYFEVIAVDLGVYDDAGCVTDCGQSTAWQLNRLQGQSVKYFLSDDNDMILRYEAQVESSYSEICLGICFVFDYLIKEDGYELNRVSLETIPYH